MSCLCFSHIHSRSSCSEARSCGKPDLLRINSSSCTNPICWLRCHLFNWSSMLLLQSESFVNLNIFSLQNEPHLVSNKHLISIIGVYLKLSFEIMACCDERILLKRTFIRQHIFLASEPKLITLIETSNTGQTCHSPTIKCRSTPTVEILVRKTSLIKGQNARSLGSKKVRLLN